MAVGRKEAFSIQRLQLGDAALVWLAFFIADFLRAPLRHLVHATATEGGALNTMYWVLFIVVPFTPLCLEFFGFYQHLRSKQSFTAFSQLVRGLAVMALVVSLMALFARLENGRLVLGVGGFFVFLFIYLRDRIFRHHLKQQALDDNAKERVIIAGSPEETAALLAELDGEVTREWIVAGHFDLENSSTEDFHSLINTHSVGRVIFSPKGTEFGKVAAAVEACELQGIEAWISASFIRTQIARPTFDVVGDKPMLVLRTTPELSWELFIKEVFDRVVALIAIILTSPVWVVAYIGVRIASPGAPAFFAQKRAGRYGKPFRMWKFRTMVPNAEALLQKIKEDHGNEMAGPVFKLQNDPRVFPFGGLLRKLSIDEFPQLINVVKGDMSLVGPRPLPLYEVEAFEKSAHRRRLSVKPGITCEWQAGGRNTITSFEQWVEMDLRYIDNWSLWLDLKIILRTIPAVLFGKGAK